MKTMKLSEIIFQFCIDARPKNMTVREIKKYLTDKGIEDKPIKTQKDG